MVSLWIRYRLLDTVSACGVFELCEHALKPRIEATFFGRSELVGNNKVGETHERLVDVLEATFERSGGGGAHGTRCRLGS